MKLGGTLIRFSTGKLVVGTLLHPEGSKNKALKVNSFTATPNEVLAEFKKQSGDDNWDVSITSLDDLRKYEKEAHEKKASYAVGATLRRIWTEGGTLYEKRDNDLIGEPKMQTLAEVVKAKF